MKPFPASIPARRLRFFRPHHLGLLAGLLGLATLSAVAGSPPSDPVGLGSDETRTASQPPHNKARLGSLLIVGGGTIPDVIRDRFLELAGGPSARIVVIPTASELGHQTGVFASYEFWKKQPAAFVTLLHTLDRGQADDQDFVQTLTSATGVWLAGGDQSRLTTAYLGTAVERELRKLIARGGVVGGTSAGAAAMSSLMIVSGNPVAKVGRGFGFLDDVVIDQHFQNRNRLPRLQGVIAAHPSFLGLGIDEGTAVVVEGSRATVLGKANVRLCLPSCLREWPGVQVFQSGDAIDLAPFRAALKAVASRSARLAE